VGDDPVKSGFVASLARPGGNLTGTTSFTGELGAKRVGLLHELLPKAMTIALLRNPGGSSPQTQTSDIQLAARAIGQQLQVFDVVVERDIDAAFDSLSRRNEHHIFPLDARQAC
jgi:putative ABC transport system substrate-binding protein